MLIAGAAKGNGSMRTLWVDEDGSWRTTLRGRQVLGDPRINKGTAFSEQERRELGLIGLIPAGHMTLDQQAGRVYAQYLRQATDLARNVLLNEVADRNEVLYYRLLADHLSEMLPVIYDPDGRAGDRALQPRVPAVARRLPVGRPAGADRRVAPRVGRATERDRPHRGHRRRSHPRHRRLGRGRHRASPSASSPSTPRPPGSTRAAPSGHARRRDRSAEPARRPAVHRQPARRGCARPSTTNSSTPSSPALQELFPQALLHWEDIGPG